MQNRFQLLVEESVRQDAEETPQEDMSRAGAQQDTVTEPTSYKKKRRRVFVVGSPMELRPKHARRIHGLARYAVSVEDR